jgi:hypothetical protein
MTISGVVNESEAEQIIARAKGLGSSTWADARYTWNLVPGNRFAEYSQKCKIVIDGEDVTNRCFFFHVEAGIVGLYLHRDGEPYIDDSTKDIAREWRRGVVEAALVHQPSTPR